MRLAAVMAAATAVLAACDERNCNQSDPKARADCNAHASGFGHGWWGGGNGSSGKGGAGGDASTVSRGGFGGTAGDLFGGFFRGTFGG